jgi:HK97 gp10 family phage protein
MGYSAKQKKLKVAIEGADKIVKKLKEMDDAAGDVLMKAAMEGGKIVLEEAKRNCPVDTGALRESLKLTKDKQTKKKATVKIDFDKSLKYGTHVELGTKNHSAQPFLRGSVDENQSEINVEITDTVSDAVGGKM